MDTDDYYWLPTEDPFTIPRPVEERLELLTKDLASHEKWVLTGSLCGWGDGLIPLLDLVIFLWIPEDVRLERLKAREFQRYGRAVEPGGSWYEKNQAFLKWAAQYDTGGMEIRSRLLHEKWLARLTCPVLRIEGDTTVEERMKAVEAMITGKAQTRSHA